MSTPAHERRRFDAPRLFLNRELSWLAYNGRVLDGALRDDNPLLERLRYLSYFATNLDEFFMIRVANLLELEAAERQNNGPDGMTPTAQLAALALRTQELTSAAQRALTRSILPGLAKQGLRLLQVAELDEGQQARLADYFRREVFPVLTPKTVDPSHPFPHLANLSHNLVVTFAAREDSAPLAELAIVEIPSVLDPIVRVDTRGDDSRQDFVLLSETITHHVGSLFRGLEVGGTWQFRVTRDADLDLREPEVEDLLLDVERELQTRTFRRAVRLEVEATMPQRIEDRLRAGIEIAPRQVYRTTGPFNVPSLMALYKVPGHDTLKDPPFNPRLAPELGVEKSIFSILRSRDLMLHHPYESFSTVTELLREAASDEKVLAMKLTLYRTSGDSVIIDALKNAARLGKSVTAVVELKARFDEKNNIVWARELESAGVHVVYGIVGLKTHCKAALVVRREGANTRRYVHLSTGNYNSTTARVYTDIGFLSADPKLGDDVSQLFNILTGYNARNIQAILNGEVERPQFHKLAISPFELVGRVIGLIEDEIKHHERTGGGLIQAKFNSLVDPGIIRALYRASCAGVRVRLLVRGICCLKPGLKGVSENIEVVSVVDRFLEHARVFHFRHGGEDRVFVSSADWMPRNLFRRIETMFPIEDPSIKARILEEILPIGFADTSRAWRLGPTGRYVRVKPADGTPPFRSQLRFIERARKAGLKSIPYDRAVRESRNSSAPSKAKGRRR
ncbi:MAG: polyphosphate kinase 1 [Myxococcales bacterium]|nr:polyphosphate kinase 1 [Myxococcales bacterium]